MVDEFDSSGIDAGGSIPVNRDDVVGITLVSELTTKLVQRCW